MSQQPSSSEPQRICVFCGSSSRVDAVFKTAATDLGRLLGDHGRTLVYGGGRVGLMGLVADAALTAGAPVIGVIPTFLKDLEVGHGSVSELVVTDSMHERKRIMYERSDAFVVLPGGLGTLDETIEVLTWTQLKLSSRPVVLVNVAGYWDPFLALVDHAIGCGFARPENREMFAVVDSVGEVLPALAALPTGGGDITAKWV